MGHLRRSGDAGRLYHCRRRAGRLAALGLLPHGRAPDLHGDQAVGERRTVRAGEKHLFAVLTAVSPSDRALRPRPVLHAHRRPIDDDALVRRLVGREHDRSALCDRFGARRRGCRQTAGRLARRLPRLFVERLCRRGTPELVFRSGRNARRVSLSALRIKRDPGLRRREDAARRHFPHQKRHRSRRGGRVPCRCRSSRHSSSKRSRSRRKLLPSTASTPRTSASNPRPDAHR